MDNQMNYGSDYKNIPITSVRDGKGIEILPDLFSYTVKIVNIYLVGNPTSKDFVLVDTGMPNSAEELADLIWNNLNEDNKVSLFVRQVYLDGSDAKEVIINKNV